MNHGHAWRAALALALSSGLWGCSGTLVVPDPDSESCETSADCGIGQVCDLDVGLCVESEGPCSPDQPQGDCPTGRICTDGICFCTKPDVCECPPFGCTGGGGDGWCEDCAAEQGCAGGVCTAITAENRCSETLLDGLCPNEEVCVGGHCVPIDDDNRCTPDRPQGLCPSGLSCASGYCLLTGDPPCSDDDPQGLCPAGQTCTSGTSGFACEVQLCGEEAPFGVCGDDERCLEGECEDLACSPYHAPGGFCDEREGCPVPGTCPQRCSVSGDCIDRDNCLDDADCGENQYCAATGETDPDLRSCLIGPRCANDLDCERLPDLGQGFWCSGGRCEQRTSGCADDLDCIPEEYCSQLDFCLELPDCDDDLDCGSTEKCSATKDLARDHRICIPGDKCIGDDDCLEAQFCSEAEVEGYRLCLPDDTCGADGDCPPGHVCDAPSCVRGGDLCDPGASWVTTGSCGSLYCCSTGTEGDCCPAGQKCSGSESGTDKGSCILGSECVTVNDCLGGYFYCDLDYSCQPIFDCTTASCPNGGDFCNGDNQCIPAGFCVTDDDCSSGQRCSEAWTCEADPGCFSQDLSIGTAVPPNVLIVMDRSASMQLCGPGDPGSGFCGQPNDFPTCGEAGVACTGDGDCDFCVGACSGGSDNSGANCAMDGDCPNGTCDKSSGTCRISGGGCTNDGECSGSGSCNICVCPGFNATPPCSERCEGVCSAAATNPGANCFEDTRCPNGTCDKTSGSCELGGGACTNDGECTLHRGRCNGSGAGCSDDSDCSGSGICSASAYDTALSLEQPTRWQQAVQAVKDLMTAQSGKVNFGLAMYPQAPDVCDCVGPQPCSAGGTCRRGGTPCDENADCNGDLCAGTCNADADNTGADCTGDVDCPNGKCKGICDARRWSCEGDAECNVECGTDCNWYSCSDTSSKTAGAIDVEVAPGSQSDIERLLAVAVPGGATPTAPTLRAILADSGLAGLNADDRANAVLLVTDGEALGDSTPTGVCEPSCADEVKNGLESDVDCGGLCPRCGEGERCASNDDCLSGFCPAGVCRPTHCSNGRRGTCDNSSDECTDSAECSGGNCVLEAESDIDCGGECESCDTGRLCSSNADCRGLCDGTSGECLASTCSDNVKGGDELGVDCGGPCGGTCADGEGCTNEDGSQCDNGVCQAGICRPAHCGDDGLETDVETDTDCGGPCGPCADGLACADTGSSSDDGANCQSGFCNASSQCESLDYGAAACTADAECVSGACRLCGQCVGGDNAEAACADDAPCTGGGTCTKISDACNVNSGLDQLYIQGQPIKTFVVGFAFAGTSENLNCAAAHGHTGRRDRCPDLDTSNCASQSTECYYTADNQADLNSAFDTIVSEVTSCTFPINQSPAPEANLVSAFLDTQVGPGRTLQRAFKFLDWVYSEQAGQIEFIGNACTRIQNGEVEPIVIVACGGIGG